MNNRTPSYDRYQDDPIFRALTDQFRALLYSDGGQNLTPSDVRAAALLASTMYEYTHIRPLIISVTDKEMWQRTREAE